MKHQLTVEFEEEAVEFLDGLNQSSQQKFYEIINRTSQGIEGPWFKKLKGVSNLYEFRLAADRTWYRLFAFYSKEQKSLLICINGLKKKQNQTPQQEIHKAIKLKKRYEGE